MKSIFVIGDSISLQYGPFLEQFLEGKMNYDRLSGEEEALQNLDIPAGANGGDTRRARHFIDGFVENEAFKVDLLLINAGLHDIKRDKVSGEINVPLKEYKENLLYITRQSINICEQMVWITTTDIDDEMHQRQPGFQRFHKDVMDYNQAAMEVMTQQCIPVIDLFHFTNQLGTGEAIFRDHAHFHQPIQQLQAAYIAGWLLASP